MRLQYYTKEGKHTLDVPAPHPGMTGQDCQLDDYDSEGMGAMPEASLFQNQYEQVGDECGQGAVD